MVTKVVVTCEASGDASQECLSPKTRRGTFFPPACRSPRLAAKCRVSQKDDGPRVDSQIPETGVNCLKSGR